MDADQSQSSEDRKDPVRHIKAICQSFEQQWRAGQQPEVEEFLEPVDRDLHAKLICELVVLDAEHRQHDGESVTIDQYLERFPEHADELVAAWAGVTCSHETPGTDEREEVEARPENESTSLAELAETQAEEDVPAAADGARSSVIDFDKPIVVQAQVVATNLDMPVSEEDDTPIVATSHPLSMVSTFNPFNWVILLVPIATLAFVNWQYSLFSLLLLVTIARPLFSAIAEWWTTEFTITGNQVMARNLTATLDVPVERVERVRVEQDAIGRVFDFGTVFVYSEGGVSVFSGLRSPRMLKESIEAKALSAAAGGTSTIVDLETVDRLGGRADVSSVSNRLESLGTGFLPRIPSEPVAAGVKHVGPDYQAILRQNISKKWLIVVPSVFVLTVAMLVVFLLAYPYWLDYSARQIQMPPEVKQKTNPIP